MTAAAVPTRRIVHVLRAGQLTYTAALRLQQSLAQRCFALSQHQPTPEQSPSANVLLLTEHPPVYTVGLRHGGYTAADELRLRQLGADFQRTNRGGLITFHGPGQLVAYPILQLKHFRPSVRWYVCALERTVIDMCGNGQPQQPPPVAGFRLDARTSPDTGVWVGDRKLCAIGVHASRYVTTHGLALNCNADLRWFEHVVPCGLVGKGVTSLSAELGREVGVPEATGAFLRSFGRVFECEVREMSAEAASELLAGVGESA